MTSDRPDLYALEVTAAQMCHIFTVGPRGTSWNIDDVAVRAVQAAIPGLVAEVRAAADLRERLAAAIEANVRTALLGIAGADAIADSRRHGAEDAYAAAAQIVRSAP